MTLVEAADPVEVTISIATMNSREQLRACLATLPGACEGLSWSAVVVDNCSADGSAGMVARDFPHVAVLENETPRGFGANHNQVLRSVLADAHDDDLVLILNDDTELDRRSVTSLVEAVRDAPTSGAVTPRVWGGDGVRQPTAFLSTRQRQLVFGAFVGRTIIREEPVDADWLSGCCLLMPVGILREVGLFDERFFMYCEDVDLTMRIRQAGHRLWECPASRIVHHGAGTTSQPSQVSGMRLQGERSYYLLLCKHRGVRVALAVTSAIRLAHAVRGYGQLALAKALRSDCRRDSAAVRIGLARYDPRKPVFPLQERW